MADLRKAAVEVNAIDDEIRHQAILGELFPDVVGVAAEELVRAVAKVGGKGGAGGNCLRDLRARRPGYGRSRRRRLRG